MHLKLFLSSYFIEFKKFKLGLKAYKYDYQYLHHIGDKTKTGLDEWCRKSLVMRLDQGSAGDGSATERTGDNIQGSNTALFSKADVRLSSHNFQP